MCTSRRETLKPIKRSIRVGILIFLIASSSLLIVSNANEGQGYEYPVESYPAAADQKVQAVPLPPFPVIKEFYGESRVSDGNYVHLSWRPEAAKNAEKNLYALTYKGGNLYEMKSVDVNWSKDSIDHRPESNVTYILQFFRINCGIKEGYVGIWNVTVNPGYKMLAVCSIAEQNSDIGVKNLHV